MRFSLRSLFILVACFSVYCGLVFALPAVLSILGLTLMSIFLPPVIVGGIIYARGSWRAFWIGCAASGFIPFIVATYLGLSICVVALTGDEDIAAYGRWYCVGLAFCQALVLFNGMIVVAMRWVHRDRYADDPVGVSPRPYSVIHRRVVLDRPADVPGQTRGSEM